MIYYVIMAILLMAALYCLAAISIIDMRRRIIPDVYLFPLLIIGLLIVVWFPWVTDIKAGAMGAAFGYTLAWVIGTIFDKSHPGDTPPIGMGDIKLIGTGGLWLGPSGLAGTLIISCILGMIWGRAHHQKYIPFAPFFAIGAFLSLIAMLILL